MDHESVVEIQNLVVFPALRISLDLQNKEDLGRLESMCRNEPTNPLAEKILNSLHEYFVYQYRANENFRAWLECHNPVVFRRIKDIYKLNEVPNGEAYRQEKQRVSGAEVPEQAGTRASYSDGAGVQKRACDES